MPREFGQRLNPVWDALRVQTLQGPASWDALATGEGSLQNKIYVWHADGSILDIFDPTEAGMNAALTAAVAGDTVIGPSINIAMTAPITIPASVTLTGVSFGFTLTFTGFVGAAVVLSASSTIHDFTLSHADGIGFDASKDHAHVLRMIVTALTPGTSGAAPLAREIWLATDNISPATDAIYYTGDFTTWIKITSFPGFGGDGIKGFFMSPDRTYGYLWKHSGAGDSGVDPVYVFPGSDLKDPATLVSGDFTKIAAYGFTVGGVPLTGIGAATEWLQMYGKKLLMEFLQGGHPRSYSEYDPVAGLWLVAAATSGLSQATRLLHQVYVRSLGPDGPDNDHQLINISSAPEATLWLEAGNTNRGHRPWENLIGGHRYTLRSEVSPNKFYLRDIDAAADVITGLVYNGHVDNGVVCGAHQGIQVYFMDDDGQIYSSDNGSTFASIATWGGDTDNHGWVWDKNYTGGGSLFAFHKVIRAAATVGRIYSRAGGVLTDLTNNFWSLISGDQTVTNVQLGY